MKKISSKKVEQYEIEQIVKHKQLQNKKYLYFIKWKGWSSSTNTWEPKINIPDSIVKTYHDELINNKKKKNNDKKNNSILKKPISKSKNVIKNRSDRSTIRQSIKDSQVQLNITDQSINLENHDIQKNIELRSNIQNIIKSDRKKNTRATIDLNNDKNVIESETIQLQINYKSDKKVVKRQDKKGDQKQDKKGEYVVQKKDNGVQKKEKNEDKNKEKNEDKNEDKNKNKEKNKDKNKENNEDKNEEKNEVKNEDKNQNKDQNKNKNENNNENNNEDKNNGKQCKQSKQLKQVHQVDEKQLSSKKDEILNQQESLNENQDQKPQQKISLKSKSIKKDILLPEKIVQNDIFQKYKANNFQYGIKLNKEDFKFNCAHFLCECDTREHLHGHNYHASLKFKCKPNQSPQQGLVADFRDLKPMMRKICKNLCSKTIIPLNNSGYKLSYELKDHITLELIQDNKKFVFPAEDCMLLDIQISSCEELANWIAREFLSKLQPNYLLDRNINYIKIGVQESPGQTAYFSFDL